MSNFGKRYSLFCRSNFLVCILVVEAFSFVGGILTNKATFEEGPREKTHVRHPSADLLSSYNLSQLKSKLGLGML